jgi:hypothetical protein
MKTKLYFKNIDFQNLSIILWLMQLIVYNLEYIFLDYDWFISLQYPKQQGKHLWQSVQKSVTIFSLKAEIKHSVEEGKQL